MAAYVFDYLDRGLGELSYRMSDERGYSAEKEHMPPHLTRLRNQERVELIMSFYRALKDFRDLTARTVANGERMRFEHIDRLIEAYMRPVKDTCHRLFRESSKGATDGVLQAMFDVYFGILFHIMLKAKENLRLRENYNIRRLEELMSGLRTDGQPHDIPPGVLPLFDRLADEMERDSAELDGEMERASFMFDQLETIFNRIIQVYHDNPTIIRSLYAHKSFFAELFPEEGVDRLFARIYPHNGPAEAYVFLAFDYLQSGHTGEAEQVLQQAIGAARQHHLPIGRLRDVCECYHRQTLADLSVHSDQAAFIEERLNEVINRLGLHWLRSGQGEEDGIVPNIDPTRAAAL